MEIDKRAKRLLAGNICDNCVFSNKLGEKLLCHNSEVGNRFGMEMGWNNYSAKPIRWDYSCEFFKPLQRN